MNWRCLFAHKWESTVKLGHGSSVVHETCVRCLKGRVFIGDCTVWYNISTGRRCGTFTEARLAELVSVTRIKKNLEAKK